jgi:hypothetical protein
MHYIHGWVVNELLVIDGELVYTLLRIVSIVKSNAFNQEQKVKTEARTKTQSKFLAS